MFQNQNNHIQSLNSFNHIFSKEFLQQLKRESLSRIKPPKSILQALKKFKQMNDAYKTQNNNLKLQLQQANKKNKFLSDQLSEIFKQKEWKNNNKIQVKVSDVRQALKKQSQLLATIDKLSIEIQSLKRQLTLLKSIASRKVISQNLLEQPSVFFLSEASNGQLQNYLNINVTKSNHKRFSSQSKNLQIIQTNKIIINGSKQQNKSVNLNEFIDSQFEII